MLSGSPRRLREAASRSKAVRRPTRLGGA
jgi:hypothetical protein